MEFPQAADLLLCRGSIFHGDIFPDIDHGKYFAVVGEDGNNLIGAFFINSEVNTNVIRTQEQHDLQIPLTNTHYPFLSKDHSFLNCADLIRIEKKSLKAHIDARRVTYRATLEDGDIDYILKKLRSSDLYSKAEKDTFFK
jgi:hypothetical protein